MLVTATARGYYKRIREPGDQFEYPLKKDDPMPTWMVESKKLKVAKATDAAEAADEAAEKAAVAEEAASEAAQNAADKAEAAADEVKKAKDEAEADADGDNPLD